MAKTIRLTDKGLMGLEDVFVDSDVEGKLLVNPKFILLVNPEDGGERNKYVVGDAFTCQRDYIADYVKQLNEFCEKEGEDYRFHFETRKIEPPKPKGTNITQRQDIQDAQQQINDIINKGK